jgi:glycosyltransferase involved in cell wall biosynthesis
MRKKKGTVLLNLCNSAPLLFKRQAVTVHDLAFEEKARWYKPIFRMWYKFMIPRICKRAKLIVTVSEFSKRKIVEKYGIDPAKIIIAPPGAPDFKFTDTTRNYGNYVVLPGVNNPRKNATFIIENTGILIKRGLKLVVLGENAKPFQNIPVHADESVIYLKHVPFQEYCTLLKNAKALIYLSLYEGFGIPVLESLCLGTTAIVSDITVFRESFGKLPLYVELDNIGSFESALDSVNAKKISREDINSLKNKFNFDLSAKKIIDSIHSFA